MPFFPFYSFLFSPLFLCGVLQPETEAYVPQLDLWLNGRIARFQTRLERSDLARQIRDACVAIRAQLRTRGRRWGRAPGNPASTRKQWVGKWIRQRVVRRAGETKGTRGLDSEMDGRPKVERVIRPGTGPGGRQAVPEDAPPNKGVLRLHAGLRKAESSVLVRARTGRIGLARFLYGSQSARNTVCSVQVWGWRRDAKAYGSLLYRGSWAPPASPDGQSNELPATNRDKWRR